MQTKDILLTVVFLVLFPLILKAEEINLTLDEAVAVAMRDNRELLLKTEELKKAKAKIAEAKAGLLPALSFTGGWTKTDGYYSKDLSQMTTQTTLKQYLYKGGAIINTIKQKEDSFVVTQALLDKTKLDSALNVNKAFYTLLLADELASLNKAILENTQEHLQAQQARYASGQASEYLRLLGLLQPFACRRYYCQRLE